MERECCVGYLPTAESSSEDDRPAVIDVEGDEIRFLVNSFSEGSSQPQWISDADAKAQRLSRWRSNREEKNLV